MGVGLGVGAAQMMGVMGVMWRPPSVLVGWTRLGAVVFKAGRGSGACANRNQNEREGEEEGFQA